MTEPVHSRTADIIAAYGGDPARWPDAERAAALDAVAASPVLTAALAAARALDADVAAWARAPLDGVADRAAVDAAAVALRRPRHRVGWALGTGLAASLAAGLVLLAPAPRLAPSTMPARVAVLPATTDDANAFAQVFTPTPDEEQVL